MDKPFPKPKLQLSGEDGNAFSIMGRARRVLQREHYSQEDIDAIMDEAMSGDYDNPLATMMKYFDCD